MNYEQEYKARVALYKLKNDAKEFKLEIDEGLINAKDFFNIY